MKWSQSLPLVAIAGVLLCLDGSDAAPVRQRLQPGPALGFTVDAQQVIRPADRRALSVSFSRQWDYLPIYDKSTGQWILRNSAVGAIRNLHLPFARIYWMDRSKAGEHLYLIVANGTPGTSLPCRVSLRGFTARTTRGRRLTQADTDTPAPVEKESDATAPISVGAEDGGRTLVFEAAPHSLSLISTCGEAR